MIHGAQNENPPNLASPVEVPTRKELAQMASRDVRRSRPIGGPLLPHLPARFSEDVPQWNQIPLMCWPSDPASNNRAAENSSGPIGRTSPKFAFPVGITVCVSTAMGPHSSPLGGVTSSS